LFAAVHTLSRKKDAELQEKNKKRPTGAEGERRVFFRFPIKKKLY